MMRTTAALALAVIVSGCGGDGYQPTVWDPNNPYGTQQPGENQPDPKTLTLTVDQLAATTVCTPNIAVQGHATPESNVYAMGGARVSDTRESHVQTGRFCINVPLREGQQMLEVFALHHELGSIGPEPLNIIYDPNSCSDDQQPLEPDTETGLSCLSGSGDCKNIAISAPIKAMTDPEVNPRTYVNDGNDSTWTKWSKFEYFWSDHTGWIMLSLDGLHRIEDIVVKWRDELGSGDQDFASKYIMMYTSHENPGDPDPDNGLWVLKNVVDGNGGVDPFTLGGENIRHMAIWLQKDGKDSLWEKYAIAEIEIWEKKQSTINPQQNAAAGSTCNTIGSGY